jgi:hypothetical protein
MRRAATAAFATVVLATAVATGSVAAASTSAPVQDPLVPLDCASLGLLADPTCGLVETVDGVLAPVEETLAPVLDPLAPAPALDPLAPAAPAPAPADGGTATPAPAPSSSPQPTAQATSSGSPTTADLGSQPALSSGAALPRSSSSSSSYAVPNLPYGSSLELSPLALPRFGMGGTPAVTANQLATGEAVAQDVVLPAAQAAAQLPDDSRTTAVVMAFSLLLLASGLLIDQWRKARTPVEL